MSWRVVLSDKAAKQLDEIHEPDLSRLRRRILRLEEDARPFGAEKLENAPFYRIRAGDWRIIYLVSDATRTVSVIQVLRRSEKTYRFLS